MRLRKSLVNSTLECSRRHKTSMLEKTWSVNWGLHHDSWRPCTLTWGSKVRMGMSFGSNNSLTWDLILAHLLYGLGDALNLPTFPIPVGEVEMDSRTVSPFYTAHEAMAHWEHSADARTVEVQFSSECQESSCVAATGVCVPLTAAWVVTALMRGIKYWRWSSEEQEAEKDNGEEKNGGGGISEVKGDKWAHSTLLCMGRNVMRRCLAS